VCAVINIVLNVMFVPRIGLTGSALATLMSYAFLGWASSFLVRSDEDRLPHRFKAEITQWCIVGACLATVIIPKGSIGITCRVLGSIVAASLVAIRSARFRRADAHVISDGPGVAKPKWTDPFRKVASKIRS
jgi:O-antigen/teichoic acid export membrane protein